MFRVFAVRAAALLNVTIALLALVFMVLTAAQAMAGDRHALVIGIGKYKSSNGVDPLLAPRNDAEEMRLGLEQITIGYRVELIKDEDLADKAAFDAALARFLERVQPEDDVLVYFSGHGLNFKDKGNFYLLPDAKSQPAFIIDFLKKNPLEARVLDTEEKKKRRYEEWIAETSISENALEAAIRERTQAPIILVADANRVLVTGVKAAAIVGGLVTPNVANKGVFRLYSAGSLQTSYERPEEVEFRKTKSKDDDGKNKKDKSSSSNQREQKKEKERRGFISLYTRTLLRFLSTPRLDISILETKVRLAVRREARARKVLQVPAFSQDTFDTPYSFWQGDDADDIAVRCSSSKSILDNLRSRVVTGSISREDLEESRVDLAPCGHEKEVAAYLRLQQQGAGKSEDSSAAGGSAAAEGDIGKRCDELAASQFDKSRPEDIAGTELQNIALGGLGGELASETALKTIDEAISACAAAVKADELVARYKYNLARAHYSKSILTPALGRDEALRLASQNARDAASLGHAAAYHMIAMLHYNGEYFEAEPSPEAGGAGTGDEAPGEKGTSANDGASDGGGGDQSEAAAIAESKAGAPAKAAEKRAPDKEQAKEWLIKGAELGHVLALYELGVAYDNGELDAGAEQLRDAKSALKAYTNYSTAAESGFLPAIIQTALALSEGIDGPEEFDGTRSGGIPADTNRAIQMLKQAAARGSPEAMYRLGELYRRGSLVGENTTIVPDNDEAFVWFSRAADFGNTRAQERVAAMLSWGEGLPAPQPEAAARYWRLAADGGSMTAQMELANRLRDGKIPFRLRIQGGVDGGAEEIRNLYLSAFIRGNPGAGFQLARLFRTGFPKGGTHNGKPTSIPKNPETAINLLWEVMTVLRHVPDDNSWADPDNEFLVAAELIDMYEKSEANQGGKSLITQDQHDQLRTEYGDPAKSFYLRVDTLGKSYCRRGPFPVPIENFWVRIWDSELDDPPTHAQFDWYERYTSCKVRTSAGKDKSKKEYGVSKKIRELLSNEFKAAAKDREKNPDTYKRFTDRVADLVDKKQKR